MSAPSSPPPSVETLETFLEHARQSGAPIQLVLGGRIDAPVVATVRARNGQTFEFVVGDATIKMEVAAVVVRTT
jgi:hypothetical protein